MQCFWNLSMCMNHPGFVLNYKFWFIRLGVGPELLSVGDADAASLWTTLWTARLHPASSVPTSKCLSLGVLLFLLFVPLLQAASLVLLHLLGNIAPSSLSSLHPQAPEQRAGTFPSLWLPQWGAGSLKPCQNNITQWKEERSRWDASEINEGVSV